MVPDSYGDCVNHLRDHASLEPASRCTRSGVAYRVLCNRVWSFGDCFWLSLEELACLGDRIVHRDSFQKGGLGGKLGLFAIYDHCFAVRFFATKRVGAGLLKEIRLNTIDRPITVRRWNMSIPISRLESSTAKRNPCLRGLLHEKSSHCCGCATTKSRAI